MVIRNEEGIALIVALIVAVVILILGGMSLYLSTQSTRISGMYKQYRSSEEAAEGAFDLTKNIITKIKKSNSSGNSIQKPPELKDIKQKCLEYKLSTSTEKWTNTELSSHQCPNSLDKVESPNIDDIIDYYDMKYVLGSYIVYIKIVNSLRGFSSTNPIKAKSISGTEGSNGNPSSAPSPSLYRIEIISQSKTNNNDKVHISVLYAW